MPIPVILEFGAQDKGLKGFVEALIKLLKAMGIDPKEFGLDEIIDDLKKAEAEAKGFGDGLGEVDEKAEKMKGTAKGMGDAFSFNNALQQSQAVADALEGVLSVGREFQASLAEVSAITGLTGDKLNSLGEKARELALTFGGDASSQLASFSGILSKLGPALAQDQAALAKMAENVNILSAASGDDAATSMAAIADTMLQLGLASGTAAEQAENSTKVINALAAGAQVGAATIPQVSQAILQAGVAAKGANLDLVDVNAAIQTLSVGGKVGSEAGIALRNVLGLIQNASGPAEISMKKLGTSSKELGEILTTQGLDAALAKIKTGMDNLGSDAERNVALFKIFGTESASAAGILIDNADKMGEFSGGIRDGMEGVGSAFEQAQIRMNTAESDLGRASAFIKDQFISLSQGLGDGLSVGLGVLAQYGPQVQALAGLKDIFPTEAVKKFGIAILNTVIPGLITTATAQAGTAAATNVATAAQYKFNAAALANPWFLAGAVVIGAIVGAIALFSDNVKSAEDAVKDLSAAQEDLNAAQDNAKKIHDSAVEVRALANEYDNLKGKTDPESQERFAEVQEKLAAKVPSAVESIEQLNEKGQLVGYTYGIATNEVRAFATEQEKFAQQAAADAMQNLKDQAEAAAATYLELQANVKEAREEKAKYDKAVDDGQGNLVLAGDWETARTNQKDAREELNKYLKDQEKLTPELRKYITSQLQSKKTTQEIADELKLPVEEVKKLSAEFATSKAEAEQMGGPMQNLGEQLAQSAQEAKKMGEAFDNALKSSQDLTKGAVSALAQALANLEIARKTGDELLAQQAEKQIEQFTNQGREALVQQKQLEAYQKEAERRIGIFKVKQRALTNKTIIDAEREFLDTLKELNDEITQQQISDELDSKLESLRQQQAEEIKAANETAAKLRKEAKDKNKTVLNQDRIKEFEEGGQVQIAIAKKYQNLEEEARIEVARSVLERERKIREEQYDLQIQQIEQQLKTINSTSEEAVKTRVYKELELLALKQVREIESIIETDEEYLRIYSDIIKKKRQLDEGGASEQRKTMEAELATLVSSLEERKSLIITNNEELTKSYQEIETLRTSLSTTTDEAERVRIESQINTLSESLERRVEEYAKSDSEISKLQEDIAKRREELERFSSESARQAVKTEVDALQTQLEERVNVIAESDKKTIELTSELEKVRERIGTSSDYKEVQRLQRKEKQISDQLQARRESFVRDNTEISALQEQLTNKRIELDKFGTDESRKELNKQISDLEKNLRTREDELLETNKSIQFIQEKYGYDIQKTYQLIADYRYETEVTKLRETYEEAEKEHQRHAEAIKSLIADVVSITQSQGENLIARRLDDELKRLEEQKAQELITEQQYEEARTRLQIDAEDERAALAARARGIELEAERQNQVASLQQQRAKLEEELNLAREAGRTEDAERLTKSLDETTRTLEEKSNLVTQLGVSVQTEITEIFSNLFTGDVDDIKRPFKKAFNVLAGALQRLASAKITEVILGSIEGLLGITGLAKAILAKSVVEAIINSLLTPVFDNLNSFAEGSPPLTTPQLAIVGDAPPGVPERVLRDDQLETIMIRSAAAGNAMLIPYFVQLIAAVKGIDLYITEEEIANANNSATRRRQRGTFY